MVEEMLAQTCPTCGGVVAFDTKSHRLVCNFCGSSFVPSHDEGQDTDWAVHGKAVRQVEDKPGFSCSACGGTVISDGVTMATCCVYCGNAVVAETVVKGAIRPDVVIPFSIGRAEAIARVKQAIGKLHYLPKHFAQQMEVHDCIGTYIPFWLFDCSSRVALQFKGHRSAKFAREDVYDATYDASLAFSHIPVDASQKFDDAFMDAIEPFDYRAAKPFSPDYMAGFFAENFDVGVETCEARAGGRMELSARRALSEHGEKNGFRFMEFVGLSHSTTDRDIHYLLAPVWMLVLRFEGITCMVAVNGQTGKVVGKLPYLKWHIIGVRFRAFFLALVVLLTIGISGGLGILALPLAPIGALVVTYLATKRDTVDAALVTAKKQTQADHYVVEESLHIHSETQHYLYTLLGDFMVGRTSAKGDRSERRLP